MLVYLVAGINGQVKHILLGELLSFLFKQLTEWIPFEPPKKVVGWVSLFVSEQDTMLAFANRGG